ncbi:GNAT family N-acetyltransferase [Mangrovibacillus cuniculi]|uniref:GNAT family N-acetyltransferase n=1 Tax=Mangrovibacillus cuniculi TaxID=2593652 RepID=A0A7S8C9J4_9BACI|nr:GNAT family N-acetyltransferase [Mangrovibacillus cuniculi]QPC45917.1 GNAT family N-acetyltransferase [Mangrovibacillus cuniculi]
MNIITVTENQLGLLAPLFNDYRMFYEKESDVEGATAFLKERIINKESTIFLAMIDAQPVGFVQLYPVFSSVAMQRAYILNDLFVASSARKSGVGQALMEKAFAFCQSENARYVMLETDLSNKKAQALYEKMGMVVNPEVLFYVKGLAD